MKVSTLCVSGGTYDYIVTTLHPEHPTVGSYELELRREDGESRQQSLERHLLELQQNCLRIQTRIKVIAEALTLQPA